MMLFGLFVARFDRVFPEDSRGIAFCLVVSSMLLYRTVKLAETTVNEVLMF